MTFFFLARLVHFFLQHLSLSLSSTVNHLSQNVGSIDQCVDSCRWGIVNTSVALFLEKYLHWSKVDCILCGCVWRVAHTHTETRFAIFYPISLHWHFRERSICQQKYAFYRWVCRCLFMLTLYNFRSFALKSSSSESVSSSVQYAFLTGILFFLWLMLLITFVIRLIH